MADAAKVNREGRANDDAFNEVLASSSEQVKIIARAVRDLVYDVYTQTIEVVWPRQRSVGWGIGPRKFSEQFAYFMPFAKHVTLGFYYGAELPDPDQLLGGGGRQVGGTLSMRSLKISSEVDLRREEVRELLEAAVRHLERST